MCFFLGGEKFETRKERLDSLIPFDCTTSPHPSTSSCRDNENYIKMKPTNEIVKSHENSDVSIDVIGTATSSPELQKITGNKVI